MIETLNEQTELGKETLSARQASAIEKIQNSNIPADLKTHFSDMIILFGKETTENQKAKQIMSIADELQLTKRAYLDDHKMEDNTDSDLLISEIVKVYWE